MQKKFEDGQFESQYTGGNHLEFPYQCGETNFLISCGHVIVTMGAFVNFFQYRWRMSPHNQCVLHVVYPKSTQTTELICNDDTQVNVLGAL